YFELVPAEQLELALWLESDRMGFMLDGIDEADLASVHRTVRNELTVRGQLAVANVPWLVDGALYPPGHPYHALTFERLDEQQDANLDDVQDFVRAYYSPDNAVVSLAGDFDTDAVLAQVRRYFGSIVRQTTPRTPIALPVEPTHRPDLFV